MKVRVIITLLVGMLMGVLFSWKMPTKLKQLYHEHQIKKHIEILENLHKTKPRVIYTATGPRSMWDTPPEPLVSLAVLTESESLDCWDLVFPTVILGESKKDEEIYNYWRERVQSQKNILSYMYFGEKYQGGPKGQLPFRVRVWFRNTEEGLALVREMIRHTDETWGSRGETNSFIENNEKPHDTKLQYITVCDLDLFDTP